MSFTITSDLGSEETTSWLVENRVLQFKFNLIDGRGESGKSSVVSKIIGDWHNDKTLPVERRLNRVLWLSQEEDLNLDIKPRLWQYGLHKNQVVTIDYHSGAAARPILPDHETKFIDGLKANGINCIVIDPFVEVKPSQWSIFNPEQMQQFINCLGRICTQARATIFGMRHMRKADGSYSSDDGIGCAAIRDTTRCVLRVDRTEDRDRRHFLSVQKCNKAKPTMPLEFGFKTITKDLSEVIWKGEKDMTISEIKSMSESKVKRSKMDQAKRLLMEALANDDVTAKDLIEEAKTYGIGDRTLDEAKAELNIRSDRRIDSGSGKAYWVWMLPKDIQTTPSSSSEKEMPQLTLNDLPESQPSPVVPDNNEVKRMLDEMIDSTNPTTPKKKPTAKKVSRRSLSPKKKGRAGEK